MRPWLRGLLDDQAKFTAAMRGLLGTLGALIMVLPADALGGLGKYGGFIIALGMFLRAGDRNPK